MCTSCHNEPLDFPDCEACLSEIGAWVLPYKACPFSFFFWLISEITSSSHLLIWVPYLIRVLIKVPIILFWHLDKRWSQKLDSLVDADISLSIPSFSNEMARRGGEIHHSGPAVNDKCAHVHVKGHVWHRPSDAARKPAELAAVITPLPA